MLSGLSEVGGCE